MVTVSESEQTSDLSDPVHKNGEYSSSSEEDDSSQEESEEECNAVVLSSEAVAKAKPSFGSISVNNSSDVHFGNKTYYQGPVTIKQFLYAKGAPLDALEQGDLDVPRDERLVLDCATVGGEKTNGGFVPDERCNGTKNGAACRDQGIGETPGPIGIGRKWLQSLSRRQAIVIVTLGVICFVSMIVLTALLIEHSAIDEDDDKNSSNKNDEKYIGIPIGSPLDPNAFNLTLPNKVKIISRLMWLAQPPTEPANDLKTPVPYVIIWHTATENCTDQSSCVFHVRQIQTYHIESKHWWDIGYNFLVGGDGNAYEGRGWTKEGAHTYGYNVKSIGISFIGTFIQLKPPEWQIHACKMLIKMGVEEGYIAKDYKLLAAKQLQGTQAPGAALYEDMKTWPHWSPTP